MEKMKNIQFNIYHKFSDYKDNLSAHLKLIAP